MKSEYLIFTAKNEENIYKLNPDQMLFSENVNKIYDHDNNRIHASNDLKFSENELSAKLLKK